jgi:hypothetical protein
MIHESFAVGALRAHETLEDNRHKEPAERSEAMQFGPRARAIILAQPLNPLRELRFTILSVWANKPV